MSHGGDTDPHLLSAAESRHVADTMQALATPSRVRILSRLSVGACSVGELAGAVEMEQSAVSQHCASCATWGWWWASALAAR